MGRGIGSTVDADAYVDEGEKALVVRLQEDEVRLNEDGSGVQDLPVRVILPPDTE